MPNPAPKSPIISPADLSALVARNQKQGFVARGRPERVHSGAKEGAFLPLEHGATKARIFSSGNEEAGSGDAPPQERAPAPLQSKASFSDSFGNRADLEEPPEGGAGAEGSADAADASAEGAGAEGAGAESADPPSPSETHEPGDPAAPTPEAEAGKALALPPGAEDTQSGAQDAPSPSLYTEADLAEARAAAHAEGHAEGLAEARAEGHADALIAAKDAFLAAAKALGEPSPELREAFEGAAARAVMRLASERAGQAIDALPQPFLERISALAARLDQGMGTAQIALHPDDHAALCTHLEGDAQWQGRLLADADLERGDAAVRAPGMSLCDLLAPEGAP